MTIKQAIEKCAEIKKQIADLESQKNSLEDKIKKYMQKKQHKQIECDDVSVQLVQVNKLIYSIENMKQCLSAQMVAQLTDKKYDVDGAALSEFINENPQLRTQLKQIVSVSRVPNKNKIEKAFSDNRLSESDVLKFATVNSTSYLKYKEFEKKDE